MGETVFTLQNVSYTRNEKPLLSGITATVTKGEFIVIGGHSGAGKSTLLRLFNRLEDPSEGEICYLDKPLSHYHPTILRQQVALVFQIPVFFDGTLLENLQQVDLLNNRPVKKRNAYEEKMHWVGLPLSLLDQEAQSLSVGEKQRAALARSALNDPKVYLLDEPTSALDDENRMHLLQAIRQLSHYCGATVLMVSHLTQETIPFATRLWQMKGGRLVEDQPVNGEVPHS